MTYIKNTWVDQQGQVRYTETEDDGYKIFTANYEEVTQLGTPVNADNMNHIEQGIYDCYAAIDTKINTMLQALYPVGSLYISTSSTNPLESLFGTWELVSEGRVLQGADENHQAGTTIAAGLPNITGQFIGGNPNGTTNGAFEVVKDSDSTQTGTSYHKAQLRFDASRSNSIYGNSTTVQPPAYVVNIWRRTA